MLKTVKNLITLMGEQKKATIFFAYFKFFGWRPYHDSASCSFSDYCGYAGI